MTHFPYSVRACAQDLLAAIDRCGGNDAALGEAMRGPMDQLMARPDLLTLGVPREGNNVAVSHYLYFDGQMAMILFQVPKGKPIAPHDHGIWESLFVYRGRLKHTVYERADDASVPGFADLRIVRDEVLERGASAVVAPPADIHGFTALADETYGITVINGTYKPDRHYYQPDEKTYLIRPQKNAR